MTEENFPRQFIEETSEDKSEDVHVSLYNRIMEMSVGEKMKLASIGNKEARGLLIKDTNKLIVEAVINNPRLTEGEVVSFAANRNYSKDVPRLIAAKKEFVKNYMVKVALVNNPKTAVATALRLLGSLHERDLKNISRSRNVATVISRTAMKMLSNRNRR